MSRADGESLAPWVARLGALDDLPDGARLVVGCSGGADSLALLALVTARGFDATAVYVDHGLRATTAHDASVVAAAAARFGAGFEVVAVDVRRGGNLEARARDVRYAALHAARARLDATAIVVGHTADDQAETIVLNFLRGSGSDGLAGMRAVHADVRRPLLGLRRAGTREVCARLGLAPVDDPMNADWHHRRVWLRREVMPRLEAGFARDLVPVLLRQAETLRDEAAVLDDALGPIGTAGAPLERAGLLALPDALARRAVRRWLGAPPAARRDVDAVIAVARGEAGAAQLTGGVRVERAGRTCVLVPPAAAIWESVPVPLPGHAVAAGVDGGIEVDAWVEHAPPVSWPNGRGACVVDADAVGARATMRAARRGERFRPLGGGGTKTEFAALAECGVAASARPRRPVLAAGPGSTVPEGTALWVLGYRIDERVRVTARTRRYLWITLTNTATGPTG